MIKKNDVLLFIMIILISAAVIVITNLAKSDGTIVRITVNGKVYAEYDLYEDRKFQIKGENGGINSVMIKDGYVDMTDANCPDKLCVHQKRIHYSGDQIVCLPHGVILQIVNGRDNKVDSVAN